MYKINIILLVISLTYIVFGGTLNLAQSIDLVIS